MPQKRERTFFVGFKKNLEFSFPKAIRKTPDLAKVLEPDDKIEKTFFASEKIRRNRLTKLKVKPPVPSIWHENKSGNISPLPYSCALRAGASHNYLLINGMRRPTSRELLRLQGFPDTFKIVVPYSQIKKQTGNSVAVPVIKAIAEQMLKSIRENRLAKEKPSQLDIFSTRRSEINYEYDRC